MATPRVIALAYMNDGPAPRRWAATEVVDFAMLLLFTCLLGFLSFVGIAGGITIIAQGSWASTLIFAPLILVGAIGLGGVARSAAIQAIELVRKLKRPIPRAHENPENEFYVIDDAKSVDESESSPESTTSKNR